MNSMPLGVGQAVRPALGQKPPQGGEAGSRAHLSRADHCAKLMALKQVVRPRACGLARTA